MPDHGSPPRASNLHGRVTLEDLSMDDYGLSERVQRLRDVYFETTPAVCIERPVLVTEAHRELGLLDQERISPLDKARVYRRVLQEREPIVWHEDTADGAESLFAGSTTRKRKGVILYPEFLALALWPELHSMPERGANPYGLTPQEATRLNREVFPYWLDGSILEWARSHPQGDEADFDLHQQLVFFLASKPNTISHTIPDFSRAIHEGLRAVIDDARSREGAASEESTRDFYAALAEAMEGIIEYSHRLAARAEAMAEAEPPGSRRRAELATLAEFHRRVPEQPARSFREGLTTIWMCWVAIHLENANAGMSLGRLDQLLYPLFRADLDSGALTLQDAIDLCACLWLAIGDHVPAVPEAGEQLFGGTGSNQAITIGGVDVNGEDAVNDLTYVVLRSIELLGLRDPNLNARYMPGVNPPEYLRRLCRANLRTGATPALHNDRAVIEALMDKGDSLAQARDYGVVGCVEPCSVGRQYGHSGALLVNLTAILELTLFDGRHRHTGLDRRVSIETGDPATFTSFDQLREAFERQVRWMTDQTVRMNDALGRAHQARYPTPILSALFEGPMDAGKGLIEGGATINSSGVAIIGLADTADSLSAIQRVVFEEGSVDMTQLLDAIRQDFAGHEALHARLVDPSKTPKWGNEDPQADATVAWIVELIDEAYGDHTNYRGGRYRVGYWTMTNHAGFGKLMEALPNGRKAHRNFTSGFTPVSGATPYLTPALNSVGSIPARHLSNGVAFNLKFTPEVPVESAQTLDRFAAAVEGYFRGRDDGVGGMEVQFNVVRREDLLDAMEHPERHPTLLVRVSGYTAYFKDLNPQMQREILERTEYELASGTATTPPSLPIDG